MLIRLFFAIILSLTVFSVFGFSQAKPPFVNSLVKSSPAFAEVLLRKVELESELETLLLSYKEEFPKVKEFRYELSLLQKDMEKLLVQKDANKLTLALGKLVVKKTQLETEVWALLNRYGEEHPDVKKAKRKVSIYHKAIKEILP